MSIDNSLKKMIIFSSQENRKLIEGVVKDLSKNDGRSESAIIEQSISKSLLPSNPIALSWAEELYNGGSLLQCYINTFEYCKTNTSGAINKQVVELFYENIGMKMQKFTRQESQLPYLQSLFELIFTAAESDTQINLRQELLKWPEYTTILDLVGFILGNWNALRSERNTYLALIELAHIAAPTIMDTPYTRMRYINMLVCWELT